METVKRSVYVFVVSSIVLFFSTEALEGCDQLKGSYINLSRQFREHNFSSKVYVDANASNNESCGNEDNPCKTLNYALRNFSTSNSTANKLMVEVSSLEIILLPGIHQLEYAITFNSSNWIQISGLNVSRTFLTCSKFPFNDTVCVFDNLFFSKSNFLRITSITFTRCGPFASNIFATQTTEFITENCVFEGNTASPMLLGEIETLYVINNIFRFNSLTQLDVAHNNSECSFLFTRNFFFDSNAATAGGITVFGYNVSLYIENNRFYNNTARPNLVNETLPLRLQPFGRGGGIAIRLVNAEDSRVCIFSCEFIGNRAEISAGGLAYSLTDQTANGVLDIEDCIFEENECVTINCLGGGIHYQSGRSDLFNVSAPDSPSPSIINMKNVTFKRNRAGTGGGFSCFTLVRQVVNLEKCSFQSNMADADATAMTALYLGPITGSGARISLNNCNFLENQRIGSLDDVPALYGYRSVISLYNVKFEGNFGGGIEISQGVIRTRGDLDFISNTAINGGGLRLLNRAVIFCNNTSQMVFLKNNAINLGGAIYATKSALNVNFPSQNRQCFLQYLPSMNQVDLPPIDWIINATFQGNAAADGGDAIFSTDFKDCRFTGVDSSENDNIPYNIFNFVGSPFKFLDSEGKRLNDSVAISQLLASDTQSLSVVGENVIEPADIALGERVSFRLNSTDEFHQVSSSAYLVEVVNDDSETQDLEAGFVGTESQFYELTIHDELADELQRACLNITSQPCVERVNATVSFSVPTQPIIQTIKLEVKQCHPGYRYDAALTQCVCRNEELYEIVRCDNRYFYVPEGIVAVIADNTEDITFGYVSLFHLNCTTAAGQSGCLVQFDQQEKQCAEGRVGDLCGSCDVDNGYAITMDLRKCLQCPEATSIGGIILFAIICIATVGFCILILYFNIGVPNELRGFLLFAQVIGLVYRGSSFLEFDSEFFTVITNLLGTSLPFPICMGIEVSVLTMTMFGFIPSVIAAVTVIVFVRSTYCIPRLANHSTLAGITLISLFVYKYVTDNTVILLTCVRVADRQNGGNIWRSLFTGLPCFEAPYVVFLVIALLLLVILVIPVPILLTVITLKTFSKTKHFSDALSDGLKAKFRWYAAWDLARRIYFILFALWIPFLLPPTRVLAMALFEVIMLIVHCIAKPYEKSWINFIESLILLDLFLVTVAILQPSDPYFPNGLAGVFALLPFIYAIPMTLYLILKYIYHHSLSNKYKERILVFLGPFISCCEKIMKFIADQKPEDQEDTAIPMSVFYVKNEASETNVHLNENVNVADVEQYRNELLFTDD